VRGIGGKWEGRGVWSQEEKRLFREKVRLWEGRGKKGELVGRD